MYQKIEEENEEKKEWINEWNFSMFVKNNLK